jgi:hypothetical protein
MLIPLKYIHNALIKWKIGLCQSELYSLISGARLLAWLAAKMAIFSAETTDRSR